jgi:Zn-dependent peptidase ImmA (M78 family)
MQKQQRAIKLANDITKDFTKPADIKVVEIAKSFVSSVQWVDFNEIDGVLVRINGQPHIGVNKNLTFTRKRFTVAHELGHFLMHEGSRIDDYNLSHKHIEIEANIFASELLMPEKLVTKTFKQLQTFVPKSLICKEMAWIYKVSCAAMTYKISELKLDTENIIFKKYISDNNITNNGKICTENGYV